MILKSKLFIVGIISFFSILSLNTGFVFIEYSGLCQVLRRTNTPSKHQDFLNFVEQEFASRLRSDLSRNPAVIKPWLGHLNHSRSLIIRTARTALANKNDGSPSRVLIVGAGNCLDIPLKDLTEMFDEVYILDLAENTIGEITETGSYYEIREDNGELELEEANLTEEERSKLRFITADASGNAAFTIAERIDDLVEKYQNGETVGVGDILNILENIELISLPFDDGYFDFISSATVLSDLLTLPGVYVLKNLYDINMAAYANTLEWGKRLFVLNEIVSEFHVRELARMLKPEGRAYLSAIEYSVELFRAGESGSGGDFLSQGQFIGHSTREVTMSKNLPALISPYFRIIVEEQDFKNEWLWQNGDDRAVAVNALILARHEEELLSSADSSIHTGVIDQTLEDIFKCSHPFLDTLAHYAEKLTPQELWQQLRSMLVKNRRLYYMLQSEFENEGVVFEEDFNPYLYRTTPITVTRSVLRKMFLGDADGNIRGIVLGGDVSLTSITRIANNVGIYNVHFYAANYVGEGWQLEDLKIGRSILSGHSLNGDGTANNVLKDMIIIHSYIGYGSEIDATVLENTVIPEGRIFRKNTDIRGIMSEEIALASYFKDNSSGIILEDVLSGQIRVPGSDVDLLYPEGRLTSVAVALHILGRENRQDIVGRLLNTVSLEINTLIRERMRVVSVFID